MPWWDNEHCESFFQSIFGREEPKVGMNVWGESGSSDNSIAQKGDCDTKFLGSIDTKDIQETMEMVGNGPGELPEGPEGLQETVSELFEHREDLKESYETIFGGFTEKEDKKSATTTDKKESSGISSGGWDPKLFDLDDSDFYPSNKEKHHQKKGQAFAQTKGVRSSGLDQLRARLGTH